MNKDIPVIKFWDDANNQDGYRNKKIRFVLKPSIGEEETLDDIAAAAEEELPAEGEEELPIPDEFEETEEETEEEEEELPEESLKATGKAVNEEVEGETDIDDFDEESFEDLAESYLRRVYENVNTFKTNNLI